MFQLSNTCEIEHLEMLAQSFSANVSTNLSKISKCCWELQTEQVVPALAGKEKRKRRHRIRTYGEKKLVGDSEMHRETYGRCASDVWDGNTVSCFCFVSSYLLWHWPKLCAHHSEDPSFRTWGRWSAKGIWDSWLSLPHPHVSHNNEHPLTHSWEFLGWWMRLLQYIFGSALSSGLSWQVKAMNEIPLSITPITSSH